MKRPIRFLALAFLIIAIATSSSSRAVAQTSPLTSTSFIQYPSLNPVTAIEVLLADVPSGLFDDVRGALKVNPDWDCASPEYYKAVVLDSSKKVLRVAQISAVRVQGINPPLDRFTRCDGSGYPGTVDLVMDSQVNPGEAVQVFIYSDTAQTKPIYKSDGKLTITSTQALAFSATPQAAPGESLTNGKTRDVGQLSVSANDANLVASGPITFYLKSTDLISTDERDSKSAFAVTLGGQAGIIPQWYFPLHLEETVQGNQVASNLSAVTSLGATTLLPWSASGAVANGPALRAPLPPDLSLALQYTHRINQLVTAKSPLLAVNDLSLNPSLSWSSIDFPFTCGLFPAPKSSGSKPTSPPVCLGIELDLGLWYLPLDLTSSKTQKAEGYGDISILVPLASFSFASKALTFVTKGDPSKYQVRVKYADSVNAANNYARAKQWTYGIELLK
jgi:hypothetical protein